MPTLRRAQNRHGGTEIGKFSKLLPLGIGLAVLVWLTNVQSAEQEADALGHAGVATWLRVNRWWIAVTAALVSQLVLNHRRVGELKAQLQLATTTGPDPVAEAIQWLDTIEVLFRNQDVPLTFALYHLRRQLENGMTLHDWDVCIQAPIPPPGVQTALMRAKADWLGSYNRRLHKPRDILFDLCGRELIKKGDPPADPRNGPEVYTALPLLRQVFRRLEQDTAFLKT